MLIRGFDNGCKVIIKTPVELEERQNTPLVLNNSVESLNTTYSVFPSTKFHRQSRSGYTGFQSSPCIGDKTV